MKWVHFQQDTQGRDVELRYFRDSDAREVDFVVVEGREPKLLVEAKGGSFWLTCAIEVPALEPWRASRQ